MKRLRVIVVEDEAVIAMLLGAVVESMGHEVCAIVGTEAEAVAEAARCKPELMIVDAHLAKGSGVAAMAQILGGGVIPHIFVTGDASSVEARRPDAVILRKPFTETDLTRAIAQALAAGVRP
jgi:CheY-like chemotaxis protein